MPKTLFSRNNTKNFSNDAALVCSLYNEISSRTLSKEALLNAIARIFGYKNYAQMVAVNKNERFYYEFHLSCASHVRAVAQELLTHIDLDIECLISAVTLAELDVWSLEELVDPKPVSEVLWFTRDQSSRDKLLAKSKIAALYWRHGISFEDFEFLYPECAAFLKQKYTLSGQEALMFSNQPWWHVAGHLEVNRDDDHFALLELEVEDNPGVTRFCYQPIDSPDSYESEFQLLATYFSETRITAQPPFLLLDNDKRYVQQCLDHWDAQPEIKRVRIYIRPEYEMRYRSSELTTLTHCIQIGGEAIWQVYNTLYFNDGECKNICVNGILTNIAEGYQNANIRQTHRSAA